MPRNGMHGARNRPKNIVVMRLLASAREFGRMCSEFARER
jgi:hypothetical protein